MFTCMKPFVKKVETNFHTLPCGKCPFCLQRRVHQWSFRLTEEEKVSFSSFFITLTYDNKNIPKSQNGLPTLTKRDPQLFFKSLRKRNKHKIKYYLGAEYGDKTQRPHYHIILFNAKLETIQPSWPHGHVHYGEVTEASMQYTCKYISKTKRVQNNEYDDRQREFSLMSKGLGLNYLTPQMIQYHKADLEERVNCTKKGGHKIAMPRYYKDKIYNSDERGIIKAHHTKLLQENIDAFEDNPKKGELLRLVKEHQDKAWEKMRRDEEKREFRALELLETKN